MKTFPLQSGAILLPGAQPARLSCLHSHLRQQQTCPITCFFTEPQVRLKRGTLAFGTKECQECLWGVDCYPACSIFQSPVCPLHECLVDQALLARNCCLQCSSRLTVHLCLFFSHKELQISSQARCAQQGNLASPVLSDQWKQLLKKQKTKCHHFGYFSP